MCALATNSSLIRATQPYTNPIGWPTAQHTLPQWSAHEIHNITAALAEHETFTDSQSPIKHSIPPRSATNKHARKRLRRAYRADDHAVPSNHPRSGSARDEIDRFINHLSPSQRSTFSTFWQTLPSTSRARFEQLFSALDNQAPYLTRASPRMELHSLLPYGLCYDSETDKLCIPQRFFTDPAYQQRVRELIALPYEVAQTQALIKTLQTIRQTTYLVNPEYYTFQPKQMDVSANAYHHILDTTLSHLRPYLVQLQPKYAGELLKYTDTVNAIIAAFEQYCTTTLNLRLSEFQFNNHGGFYGMIAYLTHHLEKMTHIRQQRLWPFFTHSVLPETLLHSFEKSYAGFWQRFWRNYQTPVIYQAIAQEQRYLNASRQNPSGPVLDHRGWYRSE